MSNRTHNYKVYIKDDRSVYDVIQLRPNVYDDGKIVVTAKMSQAPGWFVVDISDKVILLQGTGKKDVNGNEIFEGMLVIVVLSGAGGIEMPVIWNEFDLSFRAKYKDRDYNLNGCEITGWSFEVIE